MRNKNLPKTIVVKIGTSSLTDKKGSINLKNLVNIALKCI